MASSAAAQETLSRLRREIAGIEGRLAEEDRLTLAPPAAGGAGAFLRATDPAGETLAARLPFGVEALDTALGGGLPLAALSEIRARESRDGGAAGGFVLSLVARLSAFRALPSVIWISEADARRETGGLYAPGLAALGLDPGRIVEVSVRTEMDALWAFEAALSCRGVGVAVCELRQASLDLSATRRCALRARDKGVTGFLVRLGNAWAEPSAAELRFAVAPAPAGEIGGFAAGVGRMAWRLTLEKNRLGRTGAFTVEWNSHERSFAERDDRRIERPIDGPIDRDAGHAHPEPLPAAPADRSAHPRKTSRLLQRAS
jgi:protein ImuA